jgi:phage terminase large subunit-like protein
MTRRIDKRKFYFDSAAAERPIKFIEKFIVHTEGSRIGKPFLLESWQKDIVRQAYGWKHKKAGRRKHRFIYVELPKGNGKSMLLSALELYMLAGDRRVAGENYCVAGDRQQARIVFDSCRNLILGSPLLKGKFDVFKYSIVHKKSLSSLKVLSAEAYSKHGYRPFSIAFDELHVQPNRDLYDTLTRGLIKTQDSMCWMITTAGVKNTFAESVHDYAGKINRGVLENDAWLPVIYAAEEEDDPFDPEVWARVNPGYGSIIDAHDFTALAKEAETMPSALNSFKRLHLNVWTGSTDSWIPLHKWDRSGLRKIPLDKHAEANTPCWGGLDLASTEDLSSFSLIFKNQDGTFDWAVWFWCPEDTVHERTKNENINYEAWVRSGLVFATGGNVQDTNEIINFVSGCNQRFNIQQVGFDSHGPGKYVGASLYSEHGVPMQQFPQTIMNYSTPTKEMEKLILSKKLNHGSNPVLRWQADNVQIFKNTNGDKRPHKGKSKDKIDGIISGLMALGEYFDEQSKNSGAVMYIPGLTKS